MQNRLITNAMNPMSVSEIGSLFGNNIIFGAFCGYPIGIVLGLGVGIYQATQEKATGMLGSYTQGQRVLWDVLMGLGLGSIAGMSLGATIGTTSAFTVTTANFLVNARPTTR